MQNTFTTHMHANKQQSYYFQFTQQNNHANKTKQNRTEQTNIATVNQNTNFYNRITTEPNTQKKETI